MDFDFNVIVSLVAGLGTAIPLVIKLISYVTKSVKEKNWTAMIELLMELMAEAEKNIEKGSERKTWVMSQIEAAAKVINYDIDLDVVSQLVEDLLGLTKEVNVTV